MSFLENLPIAWGDSERVRGYREYALGDRMLFGTMEYRLPLLPDLQTRLLGVLSLGATSLAAFTDGAVVWSQGNFPGAERRIGAGFELKNVVRLGNLSVLHGLFGRRSGSVEGFDFSPAMAEAGIEWTPATLDAFLADPNAVVPGTRMVFWGLAPDARRQVIRYLEETTE
jgi:hypothetical protein